MSCIFQRHVFQLQKDVSFTTEENLFLFNKTFKLFGAEIQDAEMHQVSNIWPDITKLKVH